MVIKTVKNSRLYKLIICDELRYRQKWRLNSASVLYPLFTLTAQLNIAQSEGGIGFVRMNKEFLMHPDEIKQRLKTGEAYLVSKVGGLGGKN